MIDKNVLANSGVNKGKAIFIEKTGGAEDMFNMEDTSKRLLKDNKQG